jgi:DNA ligase (NAD+)
MNTIKDLEREILKHKVLYYQGVPEISDHEFDALEDKLRSLDPENNVLSLVGSAPKSGNKIKHDTKMLSLNKSYNFDELLNWIEDKEVLITHKIDGVSCSLIYKDGRLVLGKTRGDGSFGEDITTKVKWMDTVPKKISIKDHVEVRGELFCTEEMFFLLAQDMLQMGLDKPTSKRNIVAGLMGRKDHQELARYIKFMAFEVITQKDQFSTEREKIHWLSKNNFEIPEHEITKDQKKIERSIQSAKEFMENGDYQIDGLVLTFNDITLHSELGHTAHHPRYRMAFKFAGEAKITKINDIEWSVSRNGILTPVANVEPVELSGAMISRVTLHNYGVVKQFGLKSGDKIEIIRSGEVIPKFISVIESSQGEVEIPTKGCNDCKESPQVQDIRLVCINKYCPIKEREGILHFIQKIGIDDLSSKRLEEMMKESLIKTIPDLYKLQQKDLLALDKVKETLATKLILNIEKSKNCEFSVFLGALGINGGAINKCEKIVNAGFDTIDKIFDLTVEQLCDIEGFALKSATDFITSLKEKEHWVRDLERLGFKFSEKIIKNTPLKGKKICITGALSEKRNTIENRLKECGAIIVNSVSKNTDILLTNDQTTGSSKLTKALELKIDIIDEVKLNELLKSL